MFYCYVLHSEKTGRRYVGSCENLADRIRRHNAGEAKATKHGLPWALIRSEAFATRTEAAHRERYYKTGRGRDELDKLRESGRRGDRPWVQSHQPDSLRIAASVAVLAAASTGIPKKQAFGTNASTL